MTTRRCILVAASPDGQYIAQYALASDYDLKFASTLREAQHILDEVPCPLAMIIAGLHFDDSRMFELLDFVTSAEHLRSVPFLVMQAKPNVVPFTNAVKLTADKLGACEYLELHNLPSKQAQKLLRQTVKKCLGDD